MHIRNKAILEIKIAKIAQNLPKFDIFANLTLTLHNVNVFAHTTKISVSIFYSYLDLALDKTQIQKVFFFFLFCKNFNKIWQN